MNNIKIFKNEKLPFLELRYVKDINECQKLHSHEEITITALKKGSINIIFNNFTYELNPNEFICINSNIAHMATTNEVSKDGYVLYIKKEFLYSNDLDIDKEYQVFKDSSNSFINFCEILFDKNSSFDEIKKELLEFCLDIFIIKKEIIQNSSKAFLIKEYLDSNFLDDISLEELSNKFDLSSIHLIRVFKNEFGLPIHSYLLNKKVHKAKELLAKGMAIVDVAQNSGFFDQSHLNRSFKRIFQLTPKQFQKSIKC